MGLETTPALDIRQQCTGFLYGLTIADAFIRSGYANKILFVGAEVHSTALDLSTRGRDIAVIFGDGAGAICLEGVETDEPVGVLSSVLHAQGEFAEILKMDLPSHKQHPIIDEEMIRAGYGGSIITVGSVRGYHAHDGGYSAYGTSKAAVHYITKQLAFEWARYNIRVNGIAPCVFRSALTEPILSDETSYREYTARIPLGRVAEPEDFVGPTVFLASQASAMVTAHMLAVDGGTLGG